MRVDLRPLLDLLLLDFPAGSLSATRENDVVGGGGAPIISRCRSWACFVHRQAAALGWWRCSRRQRYVVLAAAAPPSIARDMLVAPLRCQEAAVTRSCLICRRTFSRRSSSASRRKRKRAPTSPGGTSVPPSSGGRGAASSPTSPASSAAT